MKEQIVDNITVFFGNELAAFEKIWGKRIWQLDEIEFAKALSTLVDRVEVDEDSFRIKIHYHDPLGDAGNSKNNSPDKVEANLREILRKVDDKNLDPDKREKLLNIINEIVDGFAN